MKRRPGGEVWGGMGYQLKNNEIYAVRCWAESGGR